MTLLTSCKVTKVIQIISITTISKLKTQWNIILRNIQNRYNNSTIDTAINQP